MQIPITDKDTTRKENYSTLPMQNANKLNLAVY